MKTSIIALRSVTTALAVIVLAAAPAFAQWDGMGHGRHHGQHNGEFMLQHMATELDMTDQQLDRAQQILDQHKGENEAARESMRAAHDVLADLMHAEDFDEAAIRSAAEEVAAAQTAMIVSHAMVMRDLRDLLTPEQFDRFKDMRQMHRGAKAGKGRGHGHRGRHNCGSFGQDTGSSEE